MISIYKCGGPADLTACPSLHTECAECAYAAVFLCDSQKKYISQEIHLWAYSIPQHEWSIYLRI